MRSYRFWRPESRSVTSMFRLEHETRARTMYTDSFVVIIVVSGAFDGWYRGDVRTHVAGALKLKEPGEVHRDLAIHAPFTLQGATLSHAQIEEAAASLGLRGPSCFPASGFGPETREARLAADMHDALLRAAPEIECATRVTELLGLLLGERTVRRERRAVRQARAYLHDALAEKISLDDLAAHAKLDKFHLVRAFRAEVGVPPYEYLTHARVSKARELLQRGMLVADAALAVGYCDESQLHRHFRRIVGVTPGRFARGFAPRQHRPIAIGRERAQSAHEHHPSR